MKGEFHEKSDEKYALTETIINLIMQRIYNEHTVTGHAEAILREQS